MTYFSLMHELDRRARELTSPEVFPRCARAFNGYEGFNVLACHGARHANRRRCIAVPIATSEEGQQRQNARGYALPRRENFRANYCQRVGNSRTSAEFGG